MQDVSGAASVTFFYAGRGVPPLLLQAWGDTAFLGEPWRTVGLTRRNRDDDCRRVRIGHPMTRFETQPGPVLQPPLDLCTIANRQR